VEHAAQPGEIAVLPLPVDDQAQVAHRTFRVFEPAAATRKTERAVAIATTLVPHLALIAAVPFALHYGFPAKLALSMWVASHVLRGLGIAIGFHRLVSHASFKTKSAVRVFWSILGMMAGQGPVLWWAAIHRRHHGNTERPGDPHSPYVRGSERMPALRGFMHAHMGWLFVHETTSWRYYIPDLLKDTALFRANQLYLVWTFSGLILPAVIGFAINPTWVGAVNGLLYGGLLPMLTIQHSTWAVNSVCHVWGTRPYCTGSDALDKGRNNVIVAILTVGDGWHNHHHAFPSTAINQFHWWQVDPAGWLIRGMSAIGLAWDIKMPSENTRELSRLRKAKLQWEYTTGWWSGRDPRLGRDRA
jgi:stearoyl-CoA desaturase (delta-9 desaturase)